MKIVRLTVFFQSFENNLWNVAAFIFNSVHFRSGLVAYSSKGKKKKEKFPHRHLSNSIIRKCQLLTLVSQIGHTNSGTQNSLADLKFHASMFSSILSWLTLRRDDQTGIICHGYISKISFNSYKVLLQCNRFLIFLINHMQFLTHHIYTVCILFYLVAFNS